MSSLHSEEGLLDRLGELVETDGVSGAMFHSGDFERAIIKWRRYEGEIHTQKGRGCSASEIYRHLAVSDVQRAADVLLPVHERSDGRGGFASISVAADLAYDSAAIADEARSLWKEVGRPNLLVQLPATPQGLSAVRQLLRDGINVSMTHLFTVSGYAAAVEAYLAGLEARGKRCRSLKAVTSLACFHLDLLYRECEQQYPVAGAEAELGEGIRGLFRQLAVSTAKLAYRDYWQLIHGQRFRTLAALGARAPRLLWKMAGVVNTVEGDARSRDALTGPSTIRAMPFRALQARRHMEPPLPDLPQRWAEAARVASEVQRRWPDSESAFEDLGERLVKSQVTHTDQTLIALETMNLA